MVKKRQRFGAKRGGNGDKMVKNGGKTRISRICTNSKGILTQRRKEAKAQVVKETAKYTEYAERD